MAGGVKENGPRKPPPGGPSYDLADMPREELLRSEKIRQRISRPTGSIVPSTGNVFASTWRGPVPTRRPSASGPS